ncbi:hypothetical protein [Janthinobacterium sp.]|uniref:hypothetical protein n=1 Tax=Janthinobacterium sp. TaxID=1871054 RepID=UPI002614C272|nr:hypothetical protein [Janthinobacterium sp.]
MAKAERGVPQQRAEALRDAIARSYAACNAALRDSIEARQAPAAAPFHYVLPDAQQTSATPRFIPSEQFRRQYALCLESLSVTVYGYCIERQFGWERRLEAALVLRRPSWWRRLLRAAPLLALTVQAHPAGAGISIVPAKKPDYRGKINCIIRLEPGLQQQLKQSHQHQLAAVSFKNRIKRLLPFFGK